MRNISRPTRRPPAHNVSCNSNSSAPAVSYSPPFIKVEGGNPETTPQSHAEQSAVAELNLLSFTDVREALVSYRKLKRNNGGHPPSVDNVMIEIIVQREEDDEARRMDEARLQSEQARKEDAKQRRDEIERDLRSSIENCSVDEWLRASDMFHNSWILRGDANAVMQQRIGTTPSPLKRSMIDLLKLEKNSRKWYGAVLPRSYFALQLTQRLLEVNSSPDHLLTQIELEIERLKIAMYNMSEQLGEVPRVFREAHDAAVADQRNNLDDDDDDPVLLVASPMTTTPKQLPSHDFRSASAWAGEVIDLS